jgi:hypothetical protein
MTEVTVGFQTIRYDREATAAAYRGVELGGADNCPVGDSCRDCKNFAAQRSSLYPAAFRALLEQLGVDPTKEEEVFTYGPERSGLIQYGGWFYFVGELVEGKPPNGWQVGPENFYFHFSTSHPSAADFPGRPVLAVFFDVRLRWVLAEPPHELE